MVFRVRLVGQVALTSLEHSAAANIVHPLHHTLLVHPLPSLSVVTAQTDNTLQHTDQPSLPADSDSKELHDDSVADCAPLEPTTLVVFLEKSMRVMGVKAQRHGRKGFEAGNQFDASQGEEDCIEQPIEDGGVVVRC